MIKNVQNNDPNRIRYTVESDLWLLTRPDGQMLMLAVTGGRDAVWSTSKLRQKAIATKSLRQSMNKLPLFN